MKFQEKMIISDLWVYKINCKETKEQSVLGREFHSLSLRLSGKVHFQMAQQSFCSHAGDVLFVPAGMSYTTRVEQETEIIVVHFKTPQAQDGLQPACICANRNARLQDLFSELYRDYRVDDTNWFRCISLLYSVLELLEQPAFVAPKRMRIAKDYIDQKYNESISIAQLAERVGLSDVYFRKEFKENFGLPPLTYLKKIRINHAKQMLQSGYYSVGETATFCGFDSVSYFSYEFRRLTGMTPTKYKNSYAK